MVAAKNRSKLIELEVDLLTLQRDVEKRRIEATSLRDVRGRIAILDAPGKRLAIATLRRIEEINDSIRQALKAIESLKKHVGLQVRRLDAVELDEHERERKEARDAGV